MFKAVIFDIGGVLQIQDVNGPLAKDVSKTFDIPINIFESFRQEYEQKLLKGEWSEERYWQKFIKETNSSRPIPNESILLRQYKKNFSIDKKVLQIIKKIGKEKIKLACLTDTQKPHTEFNKKMGLYESFEVCVFSHDTGMCKPNPKIYQLCLKKLGTLPEETIYIDDRESNLIPAKYLGIKTILYKNPQQLSEELLRLGIIKN